MKDTLRTVLADELGDAKLLAKRVLLEDVAKTVRDAAGAHSFGDRYDIVVWGTCAPVAGVGETLTVTATLSLVGASWDEAVAHRVAQPPEVALTLDSGQAGLAGQALAAVLAYYGEDEVEYAAPKPEKRIANKLEVDRVGKPEQRLRFHWLAGNAWIEHPEYVVEEAEGERTVDQFYQRLASLQYEAAMALTKTVLPAEESGQVLAALHQNLGWMYYKAGDGAHPDPSIRTRTVQCRSESGVADAGYAGGSRI